MSSQINDIQNFIETLQEELHTWLYLQRRERRIAMRQAWQELSRALGVTDRQVKRYFTGEASIPVDRIVPLCRFLESNRLIHQLNTLLGIMTIDEPDTDGLDTADLAEALVNSVERFGQQAACLSKSFLKEPNEEDFRRIRASGRQARAQILHCEKLYESMLRDRRAALEQKALRRRRQRAERIRSGLEARGQMTIFEGGDDEQKK